MNHAIRLAVLAAGTLVIAGCDSGDEAPEPPATTTATANETLTGAISEAEGLSTVAKVIGDASLAGVFDGASAYTVLAPTDAAFDALENSPLQAAPDGDSAPMIALLRNHIVTGHLRPADLRTALERERDGEVVMSSVGSGPVTFALDGDTIVARGPHGAQARLLIDRAVEANNGVLIPIDGILRELPATSAAPG